MATNIQLKRSLTLGQVPGSANVLVGEPVINLADKIIYSKDGGGNVVVIGAGTTSNVIEGSNLYFSNERARAAFTSSNVLTISQGGTGQSTQAAAINALLPSQAGNSGKYLTTDSNNVNWTTATYRVVTITDATSITANCDTTDLAIQTNTQVAGTLTINAPTGTATNGQKLVIRLLSSNVQTISCNTIFSGSSDLPLPSASSGSNKYDYLGFIYNTDNSKWQLLAKNFGF
jgi:hypothetical protein